VEVSISIVNGLTVDVEDYFHAEALAGAASREEWDSLESRVERNTRRVLEVLDRHRVRATFFILGWVAYRYAGLVREIQTAGHELGCHSYWHRLVYRLTPQEFREDTLQAKKVIEDAAGEAVVGYRAPTFSVVRRSFWALDILAELGFQYDSSIFPVRHDRYGVPDYSRFPCRHQSQNGQSLTELPLSTFSLMGTNFPFGGGGYLRILPLRYTHFGFRRVNREWMPVVVYFHPWELDPEQPRLDLGARSRFRHYTNLDKMESRLDELLRTYAFAPLGKLPEHARGKGGSSTHHHGRAE
jgi:polysaccharide deacetylase family protein (PEP-CTERM system associated)